MFIGEKLSFNPFEFSKRLTLPVLNIGGSFLPVVISDFSNKPINNQNNLKIAGYRFDWVKKTWKISDSASDYLYVGTNKIDFETDERLKFIVDYLSWKELYINNTSAYPLFLIREYLAAKIKSDTLNFVIINLKELNHLKNIQNDSKTVLVLNVGYNSKINEHREFFNLQMADNLKIPVILHKEYEDREHENFMIKCSGDFGSLLIDGLGDGIWIQNKKISNKVIQSTSFGILQACRARISRTEYISCPSCGRTSFNIQETIRSIRNKTKHLKGIKIAVMGCIVNGPGEMADADYGYIGGGRGKVNLYMNKRLIKQNIPEENAVEELLELINRTKDEILI